ncbi:MAG TPA: hypothetical protein VHD83_03205 [Puia sp.]|nr:hypothetical protein [Puia sp.]
MKKVSIIALMVITIATSAFAGDNTLNFKGAESFRRSFPQASEVSYSVKQEFTEVNFTWHNLKLQAFFDRQGNYIGLSREISAKDLPLSYVMNINQEYKGFDITEAIEFDHAENGLSYYVTVVKEDRKYVLNVATDGSISVFKKMKS